MDAYAIKEERRGPFTLTLHYDHDAENPHTAYDQSSTLVLPNGGMYRYGSVCPTIDVECPVPGDDECDHRSCHGGWHALGQEDDGYGAALAADVEALAILPLRWWTGHGGTEVDVLDSWYDANGFAYIDRDGLTTRGIAPEDADAALRGEVDTYAMWCRGDVYGWAVTDDAGDVVESCWGYYGVSYAWEEGQVTLAYFAERHTEAPAAMAVGASTLSLPRVSVDGAVYEVIGTVELSRV